MILDNRHSTIGVAQQWDQLNQLAMRIRNNLQQPIQARNHYGVAEDALKEFSMMFRHFNMASWISMQSSLASLPLELYSNLSKEMADYRFARMKPSVNTRNGQGITGTNVLFICFIRFMTFSLFEINFNYLSYILFLSQEPGIAWSSPQDYFPKHFFNN